jgi:hypothetical protein
MLTKGRQPWDRRSTCPAVVINLCDLERYLDEVSVFRFHDGRIIHAWTLDDTLSRLHQLGLTSAPG